MSIWIALSVAVFLLAAAALRAKQLSSRLMLLGVLAAIFTAAGGSVIFASGMNDDVSVKPVAFAGGLLVAFILISIRSLRGKSA
ncbi:hypothetical protein [Novosphingobium sp. ZW T3_23]|uniref:hypothetical protein n=1 Tax=Novosphingobium sp. ZW T3_23 TaxID=3378084 RepID=UPI0038543ECD